MHHYITLVDEKASPDSCTDAGEAGVPIGDCSVEIENAGALLWLVVQSTRKRLYPGSAIIARPD